MRTRFLHRLCKRIRVAWKMSPAERKLLRLVSKPQPISVYDLGQGLNHLCLDDFASTYRYVHMPRRDRRSGSSRSDLRRDTEMEIFSLRVIPRDLADALGIDPVIEKWRKRVGTGGR